MTAVIAGSAVRTCFGNGARTFDSLLRGRCGAVPLRYGDPDKLNVVAGYHVAGNAEEPRRAGRLLAECVADAVRQAGVDPTWQRVSVLVGTGLRELSAVERWALVGTEFPVSELDFGDVVREALPGVAEVVTLANACSAGGHALALAQDMVELREADAVVVGAVDTMTRSMLAMIGKVTPVPTDRVRPFDRDRTGVLLGEGAAAVVVATATSHRPGPVLARLIGTGLSCDAHHETAPDTAGIARSMRDAFDRSGREPSAVDLVLAHGTGTTLNDPAECLALREVLLEADADPWVTALKGAVGHTSGSAALINLDVALRSLVRGVVPPVVGLCAVLEEGKGLRFVRHAQVHARPTLAQVNAFGFGGVNSVTLLEAA